MGCDGQIWVICNVKKKKTHKTNDNYKWHTESYLFNSIGLESIKIHMLLTFCTSSNDLLKWRDSPWSHPRWSEPLGVPLDAHIPSGQNTETMISHEKNHKMRRQNEKWNSAGIKKKKKKVTWKCTPLDSMIFVAALKKNIHNKSETMIKYEEFTECEPRLKYTTDNLH